MTRKITTKTELIKEIEDLMYKTNSIACIYNRLKEAKVKIPKSLERGMECAYQMDKHWQGGYDALEALDQRYSKL